MGDTFRLAASAAKAIATPEAVMIDLFVVALQGF
jgi:hypothetical protein